MESRITLRDYYRNSIFRSLSDIKRVYFLNTEFGDVNKPTGIFGLYGIHHDLPIIEYNAYCEKEYSYYARVVYRCYTDRAIIEDALRKRYGPGDITPHIENCSKQAWDFFYEYSNYLNSSKYKNIEVVFVRDDFFEVNSERSYDLKDDLYLASMVNYKAWFDVEFYVKNYIPVEMLDYSFDRITSIRFYEGDDNEGFILSKELDCNLQTRFSVATMTRSSDSCIHSPTNSFVLAVDVKCGNEYTSDEEYNINGDAFYYLSQNAGTWNYDKIVCVLDKGFEFTISYADMYIYWDVGMKDKSHHNKSSDVGMLIGYIETNPTTNL